MAPDSGTSRRIAPDALAGDGRPGRGRIDVLDVLRGVALLGIVVAHMAEQYLASPPPPSHPNFGVFSTLDQVAQAAYGLLVVGKFFPIFSLLFGVSFVIQMERGVARGDPATGRFLWRLTILFAIGMAHHALYRGDILGIYALLGVPLVLFHGASDRLLLVTAAVLTSGLPRVVVALAGSALGQPFDPLPPVADVEAYFDAVQHGRLAEVMALNLREGFATKLAFQFGIFGRGYQTFGLFLLGLWLARHGWHEHLDAPGRWLRRTGWWATGLIVASLAMIAIALAVVGVPDSPASITRTLAVIGLTALDGVNLGLATLYVVGVLALHRGARTRHWLRPFAPVGRTALTVYLTQSVAGTVLLYGFGFGMIGRLGTATVIGIALAFFTVQAFVARAWMRRFLFGPVEWCWRSLTRLERMPFVRPESPTGPVNA